MSDVRPTPGPWRLHIKARREVTCECGYRTFQYAYAPDAAVASAACTKCGRVWEATLSSDERATIPPLPDGDAPALLDALEALNNELRRYLDNDVDTLDGLCETQNKAVDLLRKHGRI